jgi:hypothetical protein
MPSSRRRSTTPKHRPVSAFAPPGRRPTAPLERQASELSAFTEEWWSSWRRANALGWDYLNAMSGLVRMNMDAFSQVTRWR